MNKVDTGRIEKLLQLTRQSLKWARAEMQDGFDCSMVYHQLQRQEHTFQQRLNELREWNARCEKADNARKGTATNDQSTAAPASQTQQS